jgi:hypothetical protein
LPIPFTVAVYRSSIVNSTVVVNKYFAGRRCVKENRVPARGQSSKKVKRRLEEAVGRQEEAVMKLESVEE